VPFAGAAVTGTDDDVKSLHEQWCADVADVFEQRRDRPLAYGLVPSWRATQLSVARAITYVNYVFSIAAPLQPYAGWTAPDSGFVLLGGRLLLHWDDDAGGEPVLGPAAAVARKAMQVAAAKRPLSAAPSPAATRKKSQRVQHLPIRLNRDENDLSGPR
jgi:hypothetical protein